jgi:hypothetical protein
MSFTRRKSGQCVGTFITVNFSFSSIKRSVSHYSLTSIISVSLRLQRITQLCIYWLWSMHTKIMWHKGMFNLHRREDNIKMYRKNAWMWAVFFWFWINTCRLLLWTRWWAFGFHNGKHFLTRLAIISFSLWSHFYLILFQFTNATSWKPTIILVTRIGRNMDEYVAALTAWHVS